MTSEEFDAHSRQMSEGIARLRLVAKVGFGAALVMLVSIWCPWPWAWRVSAFVMIACQFYHLSLGKRLDREQRRVMDSLLADIGQLKAEVTERLDGRNDGTHGA